MTITDLNKRVQSFDVELALDKIILKHEKEILDLNRNQLYSGIDSKGQSLGEYSPKTVEYKKEKGQPYDRITLKDEGDFYAGFKIDNTDYSIASTDFKNEQLTKDFGKDIHGLTKENAATITDEKFTPELTKALQDKIDGK